MGVHFRGMVGSAVYLSDDAPSHDLDYQMYVWMFKMHIRENQKLEKYSRYVIWFIAMEYIW